MKGKGPVDFLLGMFLDFGAAFCLLFFLPDIPWHLWQPTPEKPDLMQPHRRVQFRPVEKPTGIDLMVSSPQPHAAGRQPAPALFPAAEEGSGSTTPLEATQKAAEFATPERKVQSHYARAGQRRDFPRNLQY